jgi:hypothetical protein
MKKTAYTPPPWHVEVEPETGALLIEGPEYTVARLDVAEGDAPTTGDWADARLIASAPALHKALVEWEDCRFAIIDALKRIEGTEALRARIHDNLDNTKSALAQAEGWTN